MRTNRDSETGMAFILALLFMVITLGLIVSGTTLMKASDSLTEMRYRQEQAVQFARSGCTEALSWIRRQPAQPVTDFAPQRDTSATPPILDTDDAVIGLVRDLQISGAVWGRYEVWRVDESDPQPTRLEFRRKYQTMDITTQRGAAGGPGSVWLLRCISYIYYKQSSTAKFNEKPNRILATTSQEVEVQRMVLVNPGPAAMSKGGNMNVNTMGRIYGGVGVGVYYDSSSGPPGQGPPPPRITGTPPMAPAPSPLDLSVEKVFGVTKEELRAMADLVITDVNDFPDPIPEFSLIYSEVSLFKSNQSLNGTGMLFIEGKFMLNSGNNSRFFGLVYATGNVTIREDCEIHGAFVSPTGTVNLQGSSPYYAAIYYDPDVLAGLRRELGQYRFAGAFRPVIIRD